MTGRERTHLKRNAMRTPFAIACLAIFFAAQAPVRSATDPASTSRNFLFSSENLEFLSVGLNFEDITRELRMKNKHSSTYNLGVRGYSGYVGFDVAPWWTVFITVGTSELKNSSSSEYFDSESRWSAGMNVNLWTYELRDPEFLAGRVSVRASIERSSYKSQYKSGDASSTIDWTDLTLMLPLGYEMYADAPGVGMAEPFSLALSAGPAFSLVNGDAEASGVSTKYEATKTAGVMGGVDIFLSHNLSFGCHVQYFEEPSYTGTIRFHF
jgi:hypothetical protein